jgi:hypothetical protein
MLNRRRFFQFSGTGFLLGFLMPTALFTTGCNEQSIIANLLAEASTAWNALANFLGKVLPPAVTQAFAQAVAAVKAWIPGTPVQDVVEVLQDAIAAINTFASTGVLTGVWAAATQIILGLLVNIIEDIDPASVPPSAAVTLAMLARTAAPPVSQKHFRAGEIPASKLKAQFEAQWVAVTGQKAA